MYVLSICFHRMTAISYSSIRGSTKLTPFPFTENLVFRPAMASCTDRGRRVPRGRRTLTRNGPKGIAAEEGLSG